MGELEMMLENFKSSIQSDNIIDIFRNGKGEKYMKTIGTCSKQDNALDVKMLRHVHSKRANFLNLVLEQARMFHSLQNILHGNFPSLHVSCGIKLLDIHVNGTAGALQQEQIIPGHFK